MLLSVSRDRDPLGSEWLLCSGIVDMETRVVDIGVRCEVCSVDMGVRGVLGASDIVGRSVDMGVTGRVGMSLGSGCGGIRL